MDELVLWKLFVIAMWVGLRLPPGGFLGGQLRLAGYLAFGDYWLYVWSALLALIGALLCFSESAAAIYWQSRLT